MMIRLGGCVLVVSLAVAGVAQGANLCVTGATPAAGCAGGTVATVQAALNAANAGDTIYLHAGTTYSEALTLPNKGALASMITITTDAAAGSLPASGVRTGPSFASFMPAIQSSGAGLPDVSAAAGANHYTFRHVHFLAVPGSPGVGWNDMVQLGDGGSFAFASQEPTDITFDQDYFQGDATAGQKRALEFNGQRLTVTNSYFTQIVAVGQDSQCVQGYNGHGPYDIENNYLECGAENIIFGGADPLERTYLHVTGNATTTQADVQTYETNHTLAELSVGQLVCAKTTGGTKVECANLTTITGTGATGTIAWSPALSVAPDNPGDIRAGVVANGITVKRTYFTKNTAWMNGVLAAPTQSAAAGSTASGTLAAGTYCYKIQAFSANGYQGQYVNGALSNEQCATLASAGHVSLSWNSIAGATVYRVWRATGGAGQENQWADASSTTQSDDGTLTYTTAATFGATQWATKNLFEIKAATNVTVSQNIFHNHWKGEDVGYAWWLKSVDQDGGCWFCQSTNLTLEYNLIYGVDGWIEMHGQEAYSGNPLPPPLTTVKIDNNLVYDSDSTWSQGSDTYALNITQGVAGLILDHNTVVHTMQGLLATDSSVAKLSAPTFTNNMFVHNTYGIHDPTASGAAALAAASTSYVWTNNDLADGVTAGGSADVVGNGNINEAFSPTWQAEFVKYDCCGLNSADYHIGASATAHLAGSDGKDIGADVTTVLSGTSGVSAGTGNGAPSISTATLPNADQGQAYSQTLAASGGTSPYTWSVLSGTLPTGLTLASGGVLSGTPSAAGSYTFTAKVTDNVAATGTLAYTVVINAPVSISTAATLPTGVSSTAYTLTIAYSGGAAPYVCSATGLPSGLALNSSTCVLSGAPAAGTFTPAITVTSSMGSAATLNASLSVVAEPLPAGRPPTLGPVPTQAAHYLGPTAPAIGTPASCCRTGDEWNDTSSTPPAKRIATVTYANGVASAVTWNSQQAGGSLSGNGSLLTNLNASALASGTLPSAVFPAQLTLTTGVSAPTLSGAQVSLTDHVELKETACSTLSGTGATRFCMDSTDHTLKASVNGAAYTLIVSGNGGSGSALANATNDVNLTLYSTGQAQDAYAVGASTGNSRKAYLTSLQGTLQQALVFGDASASTDTIFGLASSQNTGSTWQSIFQMRQDQTTQFAKLGADWRYSTGAKPSLSGCGTGATVAGGMSTFAITIGTSPGTCVATFATAPPNAPICNVTSSRGVAVGGTTTTTAFTLAGTFAAADVVAVSCTTY